MKKKNFTHNLPDYIAKLIEEEISSEESFSLIMQKLS